MDIKLMHKDTVIADTVKNDIGIPYKIVVRDGVPADYTPFVLFKGWTTREATMEEFIAWVSERCFPPNRIGVEKRLAELGLKEYNGWEIVRRTGGHMSGDYFWIDFGNDSQESEASHLIDEAAEKVERMSHI